MLFSSLVRPHLHPDLKCSSIVAKHKYSSIFLSWLQHFPAFTSAVRRCCVCRVSAELSFPAHLLRPFKHVWKRQQWIVINKNYDCAGLTVCLLGQSSRLGGVHCCLVGRRLLKCLESYLETRPSPVAHGQALLARSFVKGSLMWVYLVTRLMNALSVLRRCMWPLYLTSFYLTSFLFRKLP